MRLLIGKYYSLSAEIKASFWFMVMTVFQKGVMLLVTPFYTRLLTTSEYGYYSTYTTWSGILGVFATLSLSNGAFNNGMLRYEKDRDSYISAMQGLSSLSTIIVFGFIFTIRDFFVSVSGLEFGICILMFVSFYFYPAFSYWSGYQRYQYKYKALCVYTMITVILGPVFSLFLIIYTSEHQYAVIIGNVIVQILIGIWFYIKNWFAGHSMYNLKYWIYALKFNIPLIPHYLASMIMGQADRLMINYYFGQDKVGIYSLSYSIAQMLNIITNAINASFIPWTYKRMKENDYERIRKVSNSILVIIAVFCAAGIIVAPELIIILGTEEYLEAKWIVAPVMLSVYLTMIYTIFGNIEFYFDKSIYVMIASVISAFVNIVLNIIFIPRCGYLAAGYTTMVCYLVHTVIHYLVMKIICFRKRIRVMYDIKFILLLSLILIFVSVTAMLIYDYFIIRYVIILVLLIMAIVKRKRILQLLNYIVNK